MQCLLQGQAWDGTGRAGLADSRAVRSMAGAEGRTGDCLTFLPPPRHPRASLLHAQTSPQALALRLIPAGDGFQPLTVTVLHVVSSEEEEEGKQPWPRESDGRSLRPRRDRQRPGRHPRGRGGRGPPPLGHWARDRWLPSAPRLCLRIFSAWKPSLAASFLFASQLRPLLSRRLPEVPTYEASPQPAAITVHVRFPWSLPHCRHSPFLLLCALVCGLSLDCSGRPGVRLGCCCTLGSWHSAGVEQASSPSRQLNE